MDGLFIACDNNYFLLLSLRYLYSYELNTNAFTCSLIIITLVGDLIYHNNKNRDVSTRDLFKKCS